MIALGKRIKQAREMKGLTQENLAELVGVSRTAITRWEGGDIVPTVEHLIALCKVLDVDAGFFLDTDNHMQIKDVLLNMSATLEQIAYLLEDNSSAKRELNVIFSDSFI